MAKDTERVEVEAPEVGGIPQDFILSGSCVRPKQNRVSS